jgi:S-adenosylmethionine:tRNA ribosyltransferase-isomerase
MRLEDFDYDLPARRIAQRPAVPRDAARLLVVADGLQDRGIRDLPDLLDPGDVVVLNDTRVRPTRLTGRRDGVRIEATLIEALGADTWRALVRPARRLRVGQHVVFAEEFSAQVLGKEADGAVTLEFQAGGRPLLDALHALGAMPLPPYIRRPPGGDPRDRRDYQTVFARRPGAVAAPTAGLHFTEALLAALRRRGVGVATVTLHVGAGTFLPVKTERVEDHRMHAERGEIGEAAAEAINAARAAGGRVVAVGTTALRLLETAADDDGTVRPFAGVTDLFIVPGFRFRCVDRLLTNFHLPRSTLLMLVAAFVGRDRILDAYRYALEHDYRFYSYGDACLLHRPPGAPEADP